MILYGVIALILIMAAVSVFYHPDEIVEIVFFAFIVGTMSVVVVGVSALFFVGHEESKTHNLVSLSTQTSTNGKFFLGTGHIDSDAVFYYYVETSGGFQLQHQDADDVIIAYGETPSVTTIEEFPPAWIVPSFFGANTERYIITVPPGSITQEFDPNI